MCLVIPPGKHLFSAEAAFERSSTHCFDEIRMIWVNQNGVIFGSGDLSDGKELRFSPDNYTMWFKFKTLKILCHPPTFRASARVTDYPQIAKPSSKGLVFLNLSDTTSHVNIIQSNLRYIRVIFEKSLSEFKEISWKNSAVDYIEFLMSPDEADLIKSQKNNFLFTPANSNLTYSHHVRTFVDEKIWGTFE